MNVPPSTLALPGPVQMVVIPANAAAFMEGCMGLNPSSARRCGDTMSFISL